jgi:hypothetical protein
MIFLQESCICGVLNTVTGVSMRPRSAIRLLNGRKAMTGIERIAADKCPHIPGKTADDCLECGYLKPGPLEGSGICKYPTKQIEPAMKDSEKTPIERKRQTKQLKIALERNELQALLKTAEDGIDSFNQNVNLNNLTAGTYVALSTVIRQIEKWLKK